MGDETITSASAHVLVVVHVLVHDRTSLVHVHVLVLVHRSFVHVLVHDVPWLEGGPARPEAAPGRQARIGDRDTVRALDRFVADEDVSPAHEHVHVHEDEPRRVEDVDDDEDDDEDRDADVGRRGVPATGSRRAE